MDTREFCPECYATVPDLEKHMTHRHGGDPNVGHRLIGYIDELTEDADGIHVKGRLVD